MLVSGANAVSTAARIWLGLAIFLVIAGAVYGITSHELAGAPLLLVAAVTFCYLGLVALSAVRRAARSQPEEAGGEEAEEPHVPPTIWPFMFSIAAVTIGVGAVVSRWLLGAGVVLFALSALGWLRDVRRQRQHERH